MKTIVSSRGKKVPRRVLRRDFLSHYSAHLEPSSKTLVLSDVDGTLVRGSLVLDHAIMLHERGVIDLGTLPARWLKEPKNEKLIHQLAEAYRMAIAGKKTSELHIPEFLDSLLADPHKMYSSLERLTRHKLAGHEVVLISGSPQFLVGPFARRFGFRAVGSRYHRLRDHRLTGTVTGMFGAAAKRVEVSRMELSSYENIISYGDTSSDLPLLEVAHYSVLVDPHEETLRSLENTKISEILRH